VGTIEMNARVNQLWRFPFGASFDRRLQLSATR